MNEPAPRTEEGTATTVMSATGVFRSPEESLAERPTLAVAAGKGAPMSAVLGREPLRIGRLAYNDLVLDDTKISRTHAVVTFESGRYVIEDQRSTNGTLVNGARVTHAVLATGDRIGLGDCELVFTQPVPEISLPEKIAFLCKSELLNWLDDETKTLLASHLAAPTYPRGTKILQAGEAVDAMYFVYSGEVRVVEQNEEGGEVLLSSLGAGDFFGEKALLASEAGDFTCIASTDAVLLKLRKASLSSLLQQKPDLNQAFYRMVLSTLRSAQPVLAGMDRGLANLAHLLTPTAVDIIGADKKIKDAQTRLAALAAKGQAALIIGPQGVGRRAFAKYSHNASPHPDYPYVEISALGLEESIPGEALFGVEAQAPGGAEGHVGYLEMLDKGTLAITHADRLDTHQQCKLAAYLRQGTFTRVWGLAPVKAETRIILMATGAEAEVMDAFVPELREILREGLVSVPPLSARLKDIPVLANHFLAQQARMSGKKIGELAPEAMEKLVSYAWPGNVVELQNVIQRAVLIASSDLIIPADLVFVEPPEKDVHKLNLLRNETFRAIFRHPLIPKLFIWVNIAMVAVMAGFTLYGGTRPEGHPLQSFENNPGMLITWLVWFPLLPISAFLIGRIWCGICPIAGIGDLLSRVKRFNLPVPKLLKRLDFWMVIVSFALLDFIEEFFSVAKQPLATGLLLVIIVSLSALFCILYERKTFCRYLCPLAGMLGAYSTVSLFEVRGNRKVCQTQCGHLSCVKGSDKAEGCPMFSYPAALESNAECMMCFNCVKSCENRGVQLNLRPPLQELWRQTKPALSLSVFGVLLVGLMARHQFPMLVYYKNLFAGLNWPEWLPHTLTYLGFMAAAFVPFYFAAFFSAAVSREKVSENMARYGLAFVPLALSGHLAHLAHEYLGEGMYELLKYPAKLYYRLFAGAPIGSKEITIDVLVHPAVVTFLKFCLIGFGAFGALVALVMIARRVSDKFTAARVMPYVLALALYFAAYCVIFLSAQAPAEPEKAPAALSGGPALAQCASPERERDKMVARLSPSSRPPSPATEIA